MYPFLIEPHGGPGSFRLPTYGVLVLLAFTAAFSLVHTRARRIGLAPERLIPIYGAAALFGLLGARLLFAIAVEPAKTLANPFSVFSCGGGGLAFYGGLLGGAVGVFAVAIPLRIPGWKLADILAPALVLGLGIGRLGCFFAGCCHGAAADIGANPTALLPNGLLHGQLLFDSTFPYLTASFDAGVGRLLGIPLYPTQLWSATAGLGVAAFLLWMWEKRRFDGQIIGLMLLVEPVFRIAIESFRADERGYVLSFASKALPPWLPPGLTRAGEALPDGTSETIVGLTTSQGIGLIMVAIGAVILVVRRGSGVAAEKALEEEL